MLLEWKCMSIRKDKSCEAPQKIQKSDNSGVIIEQSQSENKKDVLCHEEIQLYPMSHVDALKNFKQEGT